VGIIPNDAAIRGLAGAVMIEQDDEWSLNRRCMTLAAVDPERTA
jgi:putative transposase